MFEAQFWKLLRQAGAELGQAQDKLKVIVDMGVEVKVKVGVEVEDRLDNMHILRDSP